MPADRRQFFLAASSLCLGRFAQASPIARTGRHVDSLAPLDRLMEQFLTTNQVPGASLAVTRQGKLMYARGFGLANLTTNEPVQPTSTFRIASVSKPMTAVAILQLVEQGKLRLDEPVLERLSLGATRVADERWRRITVRHCLQHSGGWDRDQSGDPIGRSRQLAQDLGINLPVGPNDIIRWLLTRPLDFDPGDRHVYSNVGYLVLGRLIETASRQPYEAYVRQQVMGKINATTARLGKALARDRFRDEVNYYDSKRRTGKSLYPPVVDRDVPLPDGADNFEAYGAHGGWIASAVDMVRFASAFSDIRRCPLLREDTIREMWQVPDYPNRKFKVRGGHYGLGWMVVRARFMGAVNAFHTGFIAGSEAILARRHDGMCWCVLFNTASSPEGKSLAGLIDGPVHRAVDEVARWPDDDLFADLSN